MKKLCIVLFSALMAAAGSSAMDFGEAYSLSQAIAQEDVQRVRSLIDAGANIYLDKANPGINHIIIEFILQAATRLTPEDKKNAMPWLLFNKKLQNERKVYLPKDPRNLVTQKILALELRERVIRAGCLKALEVINDPNKNGSWELVRLLDPNTDLDEQAWNLAWNHAMQEKKRQAKALIDQYLDLDFLIKRVREQVRLS